jgi:hypothetical protein
MDQIQTTTQLLRRSQQLLAVAMGQVLTATKLH